MVAGLLFMCQSNKASQEVLFTVSPYQTENGWGYRIHKQDTLFIEQATIPGVMGQKGFQNEAQAKAIGELMVKKLHEGIFPPSISTEELIQHGIVL